ncbi:CNNM domain-containing protein [Candidatus Similichlamydia epinepheli]|uniref:CNNM domain-containing protein n=1 Tax=Candidatus Similichlamydia epinepheli TaxID=1903953 RepID=UPI000D3A0E0A|nr:CNNM domain-containing protein [Candidatus Similichlamydia epinepheli]
MIRVLVAILSLSCCLGIQSLSSLCLASFFSFSRAQLKSFLGGKDSRLVLVANLMRSPEKVLVTILFLGTMGSVLCQNLVSHLLSGVSPSWLRVFVPMMLSAVIAEIIPKVLAIEYNIYTAKIVVGPFFRIHKLLHYPRVVAIAFANLITGGFSFFLKEPERPTLEEQIDAIDLSKDSPLISEEEKRLFQSYLRVARLQVREVARPIHELNYLDLESSYEFFLKTPPSFIGTEIPVISGHFLNVMGTLDIRQLLSVRHDISNDNIRLLLKPPRFVPESRSLAFVLGELKEENTRLIFVVNEFGSVCGVVSLQILQYKCCIRWLALWGIEDPVPDHVSGLFIRVDGTGLVASGRMDLELFRRVSGVSLPTRSGQTTLGGWVVAQCRELLLTGSILQIDELIIHVLSVENCLLKYLYIQCKPVE